MNVEAGLRLLGEERRRMGAEVMRRNTEWEALADDLLAERTDLCACPQHDEAEYNAAQAELAGILAESVDEAFSVWWAEWVSRRSQGRFEWGAP